MLSAYQPNATARNRIRLTSGFDTRDANGNSRVFETAIVGGTNGVSADSVVLTTRSDYELGASGNLLVLHTVDNFGRDEREYHHAFGFIDKLGNRTLFVRDMLGSVRAVLKNGTMVEWNDYYAYGAARDSWSLANGRWKYLGAEADNETGTLHLDTREHDGWVGRWWQVDPLWRLYPHQSPYIYGNANPFRFRDRNGMTADSTNKTTESSVDEAAAMLLSGNASQLFGRNPNLQKMGSGLSVLGGFLMLMEIGNQIGTMLIEQQNEESETGKSEKSLEERAKDAGNEVVGQTSSGKPIDEYGNVIGLSGKIRINIKQHSTLKKAEEAARQEGHGKPVKHSTPEKGKGHLHPTDKSGNQIPKSTHHQYPKKHARHPK